MIPRIPNWRNLEMTQEQLDQINADALESCPNIHNCFRCQSLIFGLLTYWTYETEEKKKFLVCEHCTSWLKCFIPEFTNYAKHHKK
jgi:hypothetical protein